MSSKQTSDRVGSLAGKTLANKNAGKKTKTLAGSALSQVPPKPKPKKTKR
jgi:hypothetical protein